MARRVYGTLPTNPPHAGGEAGGGGFRIDGVEPKTILRSGISLRCHNRDTSAAFQAFIGTPVPAPPPWFHLEEGPLKSALIRVLPDPAEGTNAHTYAPPPSSILDLENLVGTEDELVAVLNTLRAQEPLKTTTLNLKKCRALNLATSVEQLSSFLKEPRLNPPSPTAILKRPVEVHIRVLTVRPICPPPPKFFSGFWIRTRERVCVHFYTFIVSKGVLILLHDPLDFFKIKFPAKACIEVIYLTGAVIEDSHMREISSAWKSVGLATSVEQLSSFLKEPRLNPPSPTAILKHPVEACIEVIYLTGAVIEDSHMREISSAWKSVGHMHVQAFDGVASGLPLTLRRKPTSYAPSKSERLAVMPQWAAEELGKPPKKAKGGGKKGKKK
eukprot:CAMPEP_0172646524 /NCGR_PEP_ID=MMETSP1068-20121228/240287_1 /TAXON_ID=35684 /ORGANISM="Pseudopedinella elastica, Strain CCMP716" /LENGTH=384 /DNA_ID=CAMNT_0013460789 /DNA_START=159 /DNA_END=1313 /DNA_ORIENTATION=+